VSEQAWRAARYDEIPSNAEIPVPGGEAAPIRERDPAALERWTKWAEDFPDNDRRSHGVRRFFGISSFGCQVFAASAGNPLVVPHDETQYDQEELHLVVEGRARFVCDGEEVELGPGELLYARPDVHRTAFALETPTVLMIVGGIPGRPYEPPAWAPDWRPG
jgi:mannose-6-phosphate isomerase-like protein (cupin superfamily)